MTTGRGGTGLKSLGMVNGKKKWEARLYWLDPKTGKEREARRTFYATSKLLALQQREIELDKAKGGVSGERVRCADVSNEWLSTIKVEGSRRSYGSRVKSFNARFGDWYVDAVTPRDLQTYLDALTIRKVSHVRATLHGIFKHATRRHYLQDNPMRRVESVPDREPDEEPKAKSLTVEQVARYFDDLEANEPNLYPLVYLSFIIGCRFAEASALLLEHVDLESGIVTVKRGQYQGVVGKTKGKRTRYAGLPAEARELLKAHVARMQYERWPGWQTLLFPRPVVAHASGRVNDFWPSSTVDTKIRAAWRRCGIEVKGATHVARHTMISLVEDTNAVSEALVRDVVGHRTRGIHSIYQHPAQAQVMALADVAGRVITGTKTGTSKLKISKTPIKQARKRERA